MDIPDWRLPLGVSRPVWNYANDVDLARGYDASLADNPLLDVDVDFAKEWFPRPGRLLDLGCGTGRLLIEFAKLGYPVVGVDLSEEMLRLVGEKAAREELQIPCVRANLVELDGLASDAFDYVACLFSTLGMIQGAAARQQAVGHMHRVLRPGGRLVLHVHNWWFNARDSAGRAWMVRDLLSRALRQASFGDRPMPTHQGIAGLALHHFRKREVVGLLKSAGFQLLDCKAVVLGQADSQRFSARLVPFRAYGFLLAAQKLAT